MYLNRFNPKGQSTHLLIQQFFARLDHLIFFTVYKHLVYNVYVLKWFSNLPPWFYFCLFHPGLTKMALDKDKYLVPWPERLATRPGVYRMWFILNIYN